MGYSRRLRAGGLKAGSQPFVADQGTAWAIEDGQSSLGQVASTFALEREIEKENKCDAAYLGLKNSCHFGAARSTPAKRAASPFPKVG